MYWLEKLRNWQEKYNPIVNATLWSDLERKHFGQTPPSPAVLEERGTCCFLFRDAAARDGLNCAKPIINNALSRFWYLLLAGLEKRCEAFDDGSVVFVSRLHPGLDSSLAYFLSIIRRVR